MAELPNGTVTFLLSDVEGSTALWEEAPEAMQIALARHDALFEAAVAERGGTHIRPRGEGDSRFAVFSSARGAVAAALATQQAFVAEAWQTPRPIKARIGIHTGEAEVRDGDYYGSAVNRCARLRSIGHGGQILLSALTTGLIRDSLPAGARLVDLGEHRLRDLNRTERVYQLLADGLPTDFPPLVSLDARPNNLPVQSTPLIGREQQEQALRSLLLRDNVRLVTLTGPGGTGKTRLALQVAADLLNHFLEGVFFVDLAPISDPDQVIWAVARALGHREAADRPIWESVRGYLEAKRLLLLLDNFEQLLAAAPVVAMLLGACPGLTILVTSRARLHVRGEHEYPVPPLALPDARDPPPPEMLASYAAVALFLERAAVVRPGFALTPANAGAVTEICHRLDGLPLAIELAAARIRLLEPQAMAQRLDRRLPLLVHGARDLPARQQTLRDTIAWSHDLLDNRERTLFRRLAIFVGGWTLDAAEVVCDQAGDLDVLWGLESLFSKSLIGQARGAAGEPRFTMLETIREFAFEKLVESGDESSTRHRHLDWLIALADAAEPHLFGHDQDAWLDRLNRDRDNILAAERWAAESGDVERCLRLEAPLLRFRHTRDGAGDARERVDRLLRLAPVAPVAPATARALYGAGITARLLGDYRSAQSLFEQSLAIARHLDNRSLVALALSELGKLGGFRGEYAEASRLGAEGLAILEGHAELAGLSDALREHGMVSFLAGDVERAAGLFERALAAGLEIGDQRAVANASFSLALTHHVSGRIDLARQHYEVCLATDRAQSHRGSEGSVLNNLGHLALLEGDLSTARRLLRESLLASREAGDRRRIAFTLSAVAGLIVREGEPERALAIDAAALATLVSMQASLAPAMRALYDAALVPATEALGEAAAVARERGRALSLDEVLAEALDWLSSDACLRH